MPQSRRINLSTTKRPSARPRNAEATRGAILDAARANFSRMGYDGASMREIAATAKVDSALIFSYFGDKENLLRAVLARSVKPIELFHGDAAEVSARLAAMMVGSSADISNVEYLLIMLHSVSNAQAAKAIKQLSREHVHLPLAKWLGDPDGPARATVLSAVLMGFGAMHAISADFQLPPKQRLRLKDIVEAVLHAIIAADPVVLGRTGSGKAVRQRTSRSRAAKAAKSRKP